MPSIDQSAGMCKVGRKDWNPRTHFQPLVHLSRQVAENTCDEFWTFASYRMSITLPQIAFSVRRAVLRTLSTRDWLIRQRLVNLSCKVFTMELLFMVRITTKSEGRLSVAVGWESTFGRGWKRALWRFGNDSLLSSTTALKRIA